MTDQGSIIAIDDLPDDFELGFQGFGNNEASCHSCGGTNFKHLEFTIVCRDCGGEVSTHAVNATLENQYYTKGNKANKVMKEAVKEKAESPKKLA